MHLGGEGQPDALVEVGHLPEALDEGVTVVVGDTEDVGVCHEPDEGAVLESGVLWDGALVHDVVDRDAALVLLGVDLAVPSDLDTHPLRERVDDGRADAVESTGDLVGPATELPASVEGGHDGF